MPAWTSEENGRLLVAIMKTAQPKIDPAAIAAYMGEARTAYAVQHQIRKLQKLAANTTSSIGLSAPTAPKKPAPKRNWADNKRKGSAANPRKRNDGTLSNDHSGESPTKKPKFKPALELESDDDQKA